MPKMKMLQHKQLQIVKHDCLSRRLGGTAQTGTAAFRGHPVPFGEKKQCEHAVRFSFKIGAQTNGSPTLKKKDRMFNLFDPLRLLVNAVETLKTSP